MNNEDEPTSQNNPINDNQRGTEGNRGVKFRQFGASDVSRASLDAVEYAVGMGHNAWDCVCPEEIIAVAWNVRGDIREEAGIRLSSLCRELIEIFETVEETDEGREFHPTTIQSCRSMTKERLCKILPEIKALSAPD